MDFMRFYPDNVTVEKITNTEYCSIIRKIRELEVNMENAQIKGNNSLFNYFSAERNLRMVEYDILDTEENSEKFEKLTEKFEKAENEFLKVCSEVQEPIMKRNISYVDNEDYMRKFFFN